jgi:hypothetical protein
MGSRAFRLEVKNRLLSYRSGCHGRIPPIAYASLSNRGQVSLRLSASFFAAEAKMAILTLGDGSKMPARLRHLQTYVLNAIKSRSGMD